MEAEELIRLLAPLLLAWAGPAAAAQQAPAAAVAVDPSLRARADALIPLLAGGGDYDTLFTDAFRAEVPDARFRPIAAGIAAELGRPLRIDTMAVPMPWTAELTITYERGTARMRMTLDPARPHRIAGLLVTGTDRSGDSAAALAADVAALPGTGHLGIYDLDGPQPVSVLEVRGADVAPLGSAFKLWVLAEAARQVAAGTRGWSDVVPLGPASLPSGVAQGWPKGSPMTLFTLAGLMIALSDNTATDTLMEVLGRTRIDAGAAASGLSVPVLTTREAFVLKGDATLRARWLALSPPARAALLATDKPRFAITPLATGIFAHGPIAPEGIEWFASPRSVAGVLARLHRMGEPVRSILGTNPGVDAAVTGRFAYIGYKGGSEPGVVSMNFLAQTRAGHWFAVTGAWHRPDQPVDERQLFSLATRALALISAR